jgi:ubiquinone/menaquinone biosynthesis C-methylase UbiE
MLQDKGSPESGNMAKIGAGFNYDESDIHRRYAEGRRIQPRVMAMWLEAMGRHIPRSQVQTAVDLGCGTGRFSAALCRYFSARVIALDPSGNMLRVAAGNATNGLLFVQARAAEMPLRDGCADLVFASMVWHHIPDQHAASREIARVLRPGGYLGIRTPTLEALDSELYLRFFPTARRLNEQIMPARQDLLTCLTDCGLQLIHHGIVRHPQNNSLREYAERVALRAFSDLAAISEEEFRRGMEELRQYCATAPQQEIAADVDLFVCRTPLRTSSPFPKEISG